MQTSYSVKPLSRKLKLKVYALINYLSFQRLWKNGGYFEKHNVDFHASELLQYMGGLVWISIFGAIA